MEDAQLSTSTRPSGIPRVSRLPVLHKRPSQVFPPKDETSLSNALSQRPRLQKRSSIASFSRSSSTSTTTTTRETVGLPKASVPQGSSVAKQPAKVAPPPRLAPRPSSRGNQQKRPPSPRKALATPEDEENHDQLSSLDSFRSASRQGFHDESPIEPSEPADFGDMRQPPKERKAPRQSLSDRTMESLQNVPTTPKDRRRSSFFSPMESPMGPPPRPASAMSRNGSDRSSRPGTSDGTFRGAVGRVPVTSKPASLSAKPATRTSLGGFGSTPRTGSRLPSISRPLTSREEVPAFPRSPSPSKRAMPPARVKGMPAGKTSGSKTVAGRTPKSRPALADAFGPAVQAGSFEARRKREETQGDGKATSSASKRAVSNPANTSSAALRQQIAAAKAEARKNRAKHDSHQGRSTSGDAPLDADLQTDPFNQAPRDGKHILRNRINAARMDGKLNVAALNLKQIPDEVLRMYDVAAMEASKANWAEVVDLTRLNAADNEIEELGEDVFPDASADDFAADEDTAGNQFGGLENLDLHRNKLAVLPLGFRRLERLTILNLSHNKLGDEALGVISQIECLRDLRLSHNALSGHLPTSICRLSKLETLDVQANRLLGLPEAIREMVSLRVLNLSGNKLTTLPMDALQELRLIELDVSSNALIGPLFQPDAESAHSTLQTLRVSNNSLAALTFTGSLDMPQLRTLEVANNHLTSLPSISQWTELITLMAGDNKITELPEGFTKLRKLRNVNFTGNGIRLLDPEIGKMESLEGLVLAANPLRDKKFLTMNAHDIKRDLRARLEPDAADAEDVAMVASLGSGNATANSVSSPTGTWTLKPNGLLDLSSKNLTDSLNDSLGTFLSSHTVKHLNLSFNNLTAIPPALWLAQELRTLDLSGNSLGSAYLSDDLELSTLTELKIGGCGLTTLEPLLTTLHAPNLQTLDVTANRLTGPLPPCKQTYPALTTLLASDNKFRSLSAESLRGLQTVNLQSNDLDRLPPEIGLLWDEGLRHLEVGRNAFRVPNHRVLEKGTGAVMEWLRGRIPAAEGEGP